MNVLTVHALAVALATLPSPQDTRAGSPVLDGSGDEELVALPAGCALSVRDSATGSCLSAASTGTIGSLHPLSRDFVVTPAGRVGLGVVNPQAKLHVNGGDVAIGNGGLDLFDTGAPTVELHPAFPGGGNGPVLRMESGQDGLTTVLSPDAVLLRQLDSFGVRLRTELEETSCSLGSATTLDAIELLPRAGAGSLLRGRNGTNDPTIELDGGGAGGGRIAIRSADPGTKVLLDAGTLGGGAGGVLELFSDADFLTVFVNGEAENGGGLVSVRSSEAFATAELTGDTGPGDSGALSLSDGATGLESVSLLGAGATGSGADLTLRGPGGNEAVTLRSRESSLVAALLLHEDDGTLALSAAGDLLALSDSSGSPSISYDRETGTKNAVVETNDGPRLFYKTESPGVWFEDFGSGRLEQGAARVRLDPVFLETVAIDERHPLLVFVTVTGDSPGVFVEKHVDGFTVRDLAGGTSRSSFDWRVAARRLGPLADARLDPFHEDEVSAR